MALVLYVGDADAPEDSLVRATVGTPIAVSVTVKVVPGTAAPVADVDLTNDSADIFDSWKP